MLSFVALMSFSLQFCKKSKIDPTPVPGITASITDFNPKTGIVGTIVTITGTNFSSTAANDIVKFNGVIAIVTSASVTQLVVTVPSAASNGKITVTVNSATATSQADFTRVPSTYVNSRIKELHKNGLENMRFVYDNTNRLIQSKIIGLQFNPNIGQDVYAVTHFTDYIYDANGKVIKASTTDRAAKFGDPDSDLKSVEDYTYSNGLLQSFTSSTLDVSNPANPVTTLNSSYTLNYQNAQVSQSIIKNEKQNKVTLTTSYLYTTVNGDPQVSTHNIPDIGSAYDSNYIYYANINDPDPLILPGSPNNSVFVLKAFQFNGDPIYTITYVIDSDGKIVSYSQVYSDHTDVYTYIYEPKI